MRNYSVRYLNARGRRSMVKSLAFENDNVATDFARIGLVRNEIVEIWAGDDLVVRLHRDGARETEHETKRTQATADLLIERRQALDEWDNEGGRMRRTIE